MGRFLCLVVISVNEKRGLTRILISISFPNASVIRQHSLLGSGRKLVQEYRSFNRYIARILQILNNYGVRIRVGCLVIYHLVI